MKTFIDFLLEKKEAVVHAKKLLKEEFSSEPLDLKGFDIILTAKKKCTQVMIVTNDGQVYASKKEFMWKEGETKAILQSTDSGICTPADLKNDILAIKGVASDLTQIEFQIQAGGKTCNTVGFYEDEKTGILYLGCGCDPEKILTKKKSEIPQQQGEQPKTSTQAKIEPEVQAIEEPKSGISVKFGSSTFQIDDYSSDKIKKAQIEGTKSCIFYSQNASLDLFKKAIEGPWASLATVFYEQIPADTLVFYKNPVWNIEGSDSFIKRLKFFAVTSDGIILIAMTFGPHPVIMRFKIPGTVNLIAQLNSSSTAQWLKNLVALYMYSFNQSKDGVTILFDPEHFFKKSAKFQVQKDPPFVVGKKVPQQQNSTPPASASNIAQQTASDNAGQPIAKVSKATNKALATVQSKFAQSMKSKGLGGLTAGIGPGGSGLKNGPFKTLPSGQIFMSFRFPGVDPTQLFDQEAIEFLKGYGLWDGKLKTMYDEAKASIPDLKFAISFDGKLGS